MRWAKTIPLGLHGDAGPFAKQDSAFDISWNSLLGAAANKGFGRRWLFTVFRQNDLTDGNARCSVVGVWLVDERLALWDSARSGLERPRSAKWRALCGRRVSRKLDPDPWRLVPVLCVFRFPYWNAAGNMCWMCSAANRVGRLLWTAVGDSAAWRATRRTHAAYVAELLAQLRPAPLLFSVVIGLLLSCVMVDVLHCTDLGITAHVGRREPQHMKRTVNDSTTRSALGTDRKERNPNSKES